MTKHLSFLLTHKRIYSLCMFIIRCVLVVKINKLALTTLIIMVIIKINIKITMIMIIIQWKLTLRLTNLN